LVSHFFFLEADQYIATKPRKLYFAAVARWSDQVVVAKKQFDDKAASFWSLSRPNMASEEENFSLRLT